MYICLLLFLYLMGFCLGFCIFCWPTDLLIDCKTRGFVVLLVDFQLNFHNTVDTVFDIYPSLTLAFISNESSSRSIKNNDTVSTLSETIT